jgi:tetratricopeptide (TPR) repeat protein
MKRALPLLLIAIAAAPAAAQSDDVDRAKKHFEVAELHFNEGEYRQAIDQYRKAHALSQEPLLLFNVGLCFEKLDDRASAIASYRDYLDAEPTGARASEARYRIEKLEKEAAATPDDPPADPTDDPPAIEAEPAATPPALTPCGWRATAGRSRSRSRPAAAPDSIAHPPPS